MLQYRSHLGVDHLCQASIYSRPLSSPTAQTLSPSCLAPQSSQDEQWEKLDVRPGNKSLPERRPCPTSRPRSEEPVSACRLASLKKTEVQMIRDERADRPTYVPQTAGNAEQRRATALPPARVSQWLPPTARAPQWLLPPPPPSTAPTPLTCAPVHSPVVLAPHPRGPFLFGSSTSGHSAACAFSSRETRQLCPV